jgi:hypothetical protein
MYCTIAGPLGEPLAVVELERRHLALRVDRVVVAAVGELLRLRAREHQVERQAGLAQRDVRAQRAGAGL